LVTQNPTESKFKMNPKTKKQKVTKANENVERKGKCAKFSDDQIKVLVGWCCRKWKDSVCQILTTSDEL